MSLPRTVTLTRGRSIDHGQKFLQPKAGGSLGFECQRSAPPSRCWPRTPGCARRLPAGRGRRHGLGIGAFRATTS
eukprot:8484016-Pyramimonas_sp.AAC.1